MASEAMFQLLQAGC